MFEELVKDELQDVVAQNEKVMVQYGAGWCGNCRVMKPKFKKMATESEGVSFIYVDAEKLVESRKMASVDNLPTFAYFENGQLKAQVQTNKAEALQQFYHENSNN